MTTIQITTLKGARIDLTVGTGAVSAAVNGKPHTAKVELGHDAEVGHHLKLAGRVRAQISAEDVARVQEVLDAAKRLGDESVAEYLASDAHFADRMHQRMYGRNSDH